MRVVSFRLALTLLLLALVQTVTFAQGERTLTPGLPVNGVLDANNAAQIYTFNATQGDTVALTANSEDPLLGLTIILSDSLGNPLAQAASTPPDNNTAIISDVAVVTPGAHYVTVFPTPGIGATTSGSFTLTLEIIGAVVPETTLEPEVEVETPEAVAPPVATATTPPTVAPQPTPAVVDPASFQVSQIILNGGIDVRLTWNTNDDLNLQIRDPLGNTLFWDSRETPNSGSFGPDVNGLCEIINTPPNVENATWSGGPLPTGSYEILVYHRQACETPNPVPFTVNINVNGTDLPPLTGTIQPPTGGEATVFISSFTVQDDGTASIGAQGPYTDTTVLPISIGEILNNPAQTINNEQTLQGVITNNQYFQTYKFQGEAGQNVPVSMTAAEGNLDTLLLVLNSVGTIVGANDDILVANDTNSRVEGLRLPTTDTYTVFASRYGKDVGGTEGIYDLTLSTSSVPQALANLNLPSGDVEVTLTWNTNADLQLLVRDPFGNPVYDDALRVPSGGELTATGNRNCATTTGTPVYHTYWPTGFLTPGSYEVDVWYQSECNDTRPVTFTLFQVVNGEVETRTVPIRFREHYVTSFEIAPDGSVQFYPGGILGGSETIPFQTEEAQASTVTIRPNENLVGNISNQNKFDLFTFQGSVNDVVSIRMNATSRTLDPLLFLISPNGIEIASNDDFGDTIDSVISNITLTQDGTYTIIATHYGGIYGGTSGPYNLSLNIQSTSEADGG
jgi:hypothetical protein